MNYFAYLLRQAWASLKKKPGFIATIVSTMGITSGALLCVLTLAYVMIFKPLPYPEQDKLYQVEQVLLKKSGIPFLTGFSYPTLLEAYKKQSVFSQVAISMQSEVTISSESSHPLVLASYISPQWFSLLGTPLQTGRLFEDTEAINSNNPVAVLSYNTWQKDFAGDRAIVNKKVRLNNVSYTIIGVTAKHFIQPHIKDAGIDSGIFLPWDFNPLSYRHDWWDSFDPSYAMFGKLASQSASQTQQAMTQLINNSWQAQVVGDAYFAGMSLKTEVKPLQDAIIKNSSATVYLLVAGAVALLLMAIGNISNLFLSRAAEQQHKLAIIACLGANKKQLFFTQLVEASLLVLFSFITAIIISLFGFEVLKQYLSNVLPRVSELALNTYSVALVAGLCVAIAVLFAYRSQKAINFQQLNTQLMNGSKGMGIQVSKGIRQLLIVSQVMLTSIITFICISLFLGAVSTISTPLGYQTQDVVDLNFSLSQDNQQRLNAAQRLAIIKELKTNLQNLPQVDAVSVAVSPLSDFMQLAVKQAANDKYHNVFTSFIDNQYFSLINQPLLSGSLFKDIISTEPEPVVIVNDVFAKLLAKDGDVLGEKVSFDANNENLVTVIGVVKSIIQPGATANIPRMYVPSHAQATQFLLKLKDDQVITREQAIEAAGQVSSLYVLNQLAPLQDTLMAMLAAHYITAFTTLVLALITLVLSYFGLYGILSYATQMRRLEIGTRMAIGAKGWHLIKLIVKENTSPIVGGIISGVIVLLGLFIYLTKGASVQVNEYLNWQILPVLLVTLGFISLISFAACYLPLRQYIKRPAMESLKAMN